MRCWKPIAGAGSRRTAGAGLHGHSNSRTRSPARSAAGSAPGPVQRNFFPTSPCRPDDAFPRPAHARLPASQAKKSSPPRAQVYAQGHSPARSSTRRRASDANNYEEIRYEGFGPGGVALIVEALSDNRNRTATNVRTAFSKNGGNLGASGSVSHGFERPRPDRISGRRGRFRQGARSGDRGRGRRRRERRGRPPPSGPAVEKPARGRPGARSRCSAKREGARLAWKPATEVEVRGERARHTLPKLIDALDEDDDAQTVWGTDAYPTKSSRTSLANAHPRS